MLNIIIKMESWIIKFNQIKHGQIKPPQVDYLTFMIHPKISVRMILRKGRNPIQQILQGPQSVKVIDINIQIHLQEIKLNHPIWLINLNSRG